MTTAWGWRPERTQGIWRHGAIWFQSLAALAPWASLVLAMMTLYVVGDTLTVSRGVLFDLPDTGAQEGATTSLVATVMPLRNETTVFFDDARYSLEDGASTVILGEHLTRRLASVPHKTLLLLADRRVPCEDLMRLAVVARQSGVSKVLFATKRAEERGE